MMKILPFSPEFESQVVDLIVGIQSGEFGIDISVDDQPDLRSIPSFYYRGSEGLRGAPETSGSRSAMTA
jgi:hypothetical protein